MTLPTLITNYQKKVTVQQLKKTYSQLNTMLSRVKADQGDLQVFSKDPSVFVPEVVAKYYNGAIVYPANTSHELAMCYDEHSYIAGAGRAQYGILTASGNSGGYISTPFLGSTRSIKLSDGTCIGFNSLAEGVGYPQTSIFVDINGSNRRPNVLGLDLFFFTYDAKSETIKPSGWELENPKCSQTATGYGLRGALCASQIINDGWEIKGDYPWKGR